MTHLKLQNVTCKRRLHVRADATEQAACRPWLEAELAAVRRASH